MGGCIDLWHLILGGQHFCDETWQRGVRKIPNLRDGIYEWSLTKNSDANLTCYVNRCWTKLIKVTWLLNEETIKWFIYHLYNIKIRCSVKISVLPKSSLNCIVYCTSQFFRPQSWGLRNSKTEFWNPGDSRSGYLLPSFPDYWFAPGVQSHLQVP